MKTKIAVAILVALGGGVQVAVAGGPATGGSSEFTQIANNVQLGLIYAKEVSAYITQALQYKTQLQNLIDNPFGLLGKDIGGLMNGVGQLMAAGKSIGSTMANIDKNFALKFKNPLAGDLATKFTTWHETNTDTLQGALKSVGLHRDQFKTDAQAITALYNSASQVNGQLAATKVVAEIAAQQMIQLQSLQDLISAQNLATSTFMASQTSREEATNQQNISMGKAYVPTYEKHGTEKIIDWKSIMPK